MPPKMAYKIGNKIVKFIPTEEQEQSALIDWARTQPWNKLFFHIPNGGFRHISTGVALKRMGVLPGVPDLFLAIAMGHYHGLFIEMKAYNKKFSKHQERMAHKLIEQGYCVYLGNKGWDTTKLFIENYMKGNHG